LLNPWIFMCAQTNEEVRPVAAGPEEIPEEIPVAMSGRRD